MNVRHVEFIDEEIRDGQKRVTQVVTTPHFPRKYIHEPNFKEAAGEATLHHFKDWSREELIAHLLNAERLREEAERNGALVRAAASVAAEQKESELRAQLERNGFDFNTATMAHRDEITRYENTVEILAAKLASAVVAHRHQFKERERLTHALSDVRAEVTMLKLEAQRKARG